MSLKCQIFRKRLTFFHNVLELSCDVRIIIFLCCLIAILPPNIKCAKLTNPQIRLLINDDDLLQEKTSRHEAAAAAAAVSATGADNSGEHFNLYRSELKRLSYETIHRILRDENEPSYRREETELRYYQKRSPPAYEDTHQMNKRSAEEHSLSLNYSKRNLREFKITAQLSKELSSASSLDLSDNRLTSLNLSLIINEHLHSLNLSNNSFDYIPLTEKSSLKTLNLNSNNISTSSLASNVYLRNLYLSANRIENLSSLNLALLKNLEILDISCNRLKNLETSFFPERMHNLKHLNLAHNQLGAIYRETFYNLLSLNTLLLSHNNITDIDYETFLALPNLQYLDLSFNRLKGKSIRALQGITGLVALNIAYNPELGPFMQEFVASWSLKELDASGTGLCQIPAALAQSVRSLKLTHNWLKVINCGDLDSYPLLQYLDLSFSHIEHIEDDALGRLEILEILMLDHNDLKKIPISLPVSLEHLFLQNNNIMDIQSQSFQGLTSLKTLDLSHNKLLYLPDIALPKLQTLNLQSAEIRGISQGIVHTLPRLNELMLEDNPIKCSDLLGIAEWASTCRLRTTKEDMDENAEEQNEDEDAEGGAQRRGDIKKKFMKMYNFYEKFEGVECQLKNVTVQLLQMPAPLCSSGLPDNSQAKPQHGQELQQLQTPKNSFVSSSTPSLSETAEVENFNLNSIINAIPLPSKKAVKTPTEQPNKTAAIVDVPAAAKAITTEMPKTAMPELKQITETSQRSITTITTTAGAPSLARIPTTLVALRSEDKPQEHTRSTNEMKTFRETPTSATLTNALKGTDRTTTDTSSSRSSSGSGSNSSGNTPNVVGVKQTLPLKKEESLRTANLPETLKQNVPEKIIKNDDDANDNNNSNNKEIQRQKEEIAAIRSALQPPPSKATINSQKPVMATTMSPAMINLLQNKTEDIKTKIGPTTAIKSFEGTTIEASKESAKGFPPTTRTTDMPLKSPTTDKEGTADTATTSSNKELNDLTTTNSTSNSKTIAPTIRTPKISSALPATTLMGTASKRPQETTTIEEEGQTRTTSRTSTLKTIELTTTSAALLQDKDLTSNYTDNSQSNSKNNSHSAIASHTNNGQDNKTLVTLHITTTTTTPITPNIALHTNIKAAQTPTQARTKTPQKQHEQQRQQSLTDTIKQQHPSMTTTTTTTPASPPPPPPLERNDVNADCMQSNSDGCISGRPQRQDKEETVIGKTPTARETITTNMEVSTTTTATTSRTPRDTMIFSETTTTTAEAAVAAAAIMSTTTTVKTTAATATTVAATPMPTPTAHKHEPLQLHIKDRHLIGTPLLMHKGDNLMVATDELIKANPQDFSKRTTTTKTTAAPSQPPPPTTASTTTTSAVTGPQNAGVAAKNKQTILENSQLRKSSKNSDVIEQQKLQQHSRQEPFEHKGETIKPKDYSPYVKKSNGDMKTKKPSLIMKKMTIVTKQHETTTAATPSQQQDSQEVVKAHEMLQHYQELKPLHSLSDSDNKDAVVQFSHSKHSTVNTPISSKQSHLAHEPQTFQHEHELLMQQVLHDEQQQQHEKASQSEQWSDLRKANNKDNHPGLIVLVSSGLFVVLLLGLMHVYRCDVPWRRNSPAHHLRPHQRHNGSLDDDVHSFLSYNEGMQKWHHSTRLEAPYSSPLHNLHVRELQKTSATEKPATFKTSTSYATTAASNSNRSHILPRTNSQSSSATTRTTSPSSSAILDDETFYIEMTPPAGKFAQALQSELLPMELLNLAQTKSAEIRETSAADLQMSLEDDYDFSTSSRTHQTTPYKPTTAIMGNTAHSRSDLFASSAAATTTTTSASNAYNSQKPLYNSRKFGLW